MTVPRHISTPALPSQLGGPGNDPDHSIEPDGMCQCDSGDPRDVLPWGECRRCFRLHPNGVNPHVLHG